MSSKVDEGAGATLGPPVEGSGAGSSSEPRVFPDPRKALDEPPADSLACRPFPPLSRQPLTYTDGRGLTRQLVSGCQRRDPCVPSSWAHRGSELPNHYIVSFEAPGSMNCYEPLFSTSVEFLSSLLLILVLVIIFIILVRQPSCRSRRM
jgi:hypothetical protein